MTRAHIARSEEVQHAARSIAWSGAALKRLRVEAGVAPEVMAKAVGYSLAGLRVIEGRKFVTVRVAARYREALNTAASEATESIESTKPVANGPTDDELRVAILDTSYPGQVFDGMDVVSALRRLPLIVSDMQIRRVLIDMVKRADLVVTTYWGGQPGYRFADTSAPASPLRGAPSNLVLTNGRRLSPEHRANISASLRRKGLK